MSMITELVERLRESADDTELDMECSRACDGECNKLLREAADVIEELSTKLQVANMERSSQYLNGGWIPCSERLPKEYAYVICSTNAEEIFMATYLGKMNDGVDCFDDEDGMMWEGDVIAWMPSPQAYKEGDGNDD